MPTSPRFGAATSAPATAPRRKRPLLKRGLLAGAMTIAVAAWTAAPSIAAPPESAHWFSSNSVWRKPLAAHTPVSSHSHLYVSSLVHDVHHGGSPWINTTYCSTPIYTVPRSQRRIKVTLTKRYAPLQQAWLHVPIPARAKPSVGTDRQLVVWQPSTNSMWEFWDLRKRNGHFRAAWGGAIHNLSRNPGYYTGASAPWGATATSLPLLGGLITINDLQRGSIDHALAMAVPNTAHKEFVFPAQRTDGDDYARGAIPEGMRFRLPADLNLAKLHLPPVTLMLARAAQRYGIIVRDTSANVSFYAQDPTPLGYNPYTAVGGFWGPDTWPNQLMDAFPWKRLKVVASPIQHAWNAWSEA